MDRRATSGGTESKTYILHTARRVTSKFDSGALVTVASSPRVDSFRNEYPREDSEKLSKTMSGNCREAGIFEVRRLGELTRLETAFCTLLPLLMVNAVVSLWLASRLTAGPSEATNGSAGSTDGS